MSEGMKIIFATPAERSEETERVKELANSKKCMALKKNLAAAYQVIADRGLDDGLAAHISLRVPDAPGYFWVSTLGYLFSECTPERLALINHKGEIVDGGPQINLAGFLIHAAIHAARPDVICAAHTHAPAGRTFSALGRPLQMFDQNCCKFYDDCGVYADYTGVVVDADQSAGICAALGDKRALILQNHGLITVADTLEQAVIDMLDLEDTCAANLRLIATGQAGVTVAAGPAQQARTMQTFPMRYQAQWYAMMRELAQRNSVVASFM